MKAAILLCIVAIFSSNQSPVQDTQVREYWVDPSTGLIWAGKDNRKDVSWKKAMKYCRDLRLAGNSDWTLPTLSQLETIYDKTVDAAGLARFGGPAKGRAFAWHVKGNLFLTGDEWSSERSYDDRGHPSGYAYYFDFNEGQRRDDPIGWPYSFAISRVVCAPFQ